ncbi:hypothetical protein THIOKS11140024 [Thiocapsa sp. KS1]|nr:hypothetical protein THIOKS11140024 [Thiocapsa sp. KS1]
MDCRNRPAAFKASPLSTSEPALPAHSHRNPKDDVPEALYGIFPEIGLAGTGGLGALLYLARHPKTLRSS